MLHRYYVELADQFRGQNIQYQNHKAYQYLYGAITSMNILQV